MATHLLSLTSLVDDYQVTIDNRARIESIGVSVTMPAVTGRQSRGLPLYKSGLDQTTGNLGVGNPLVIYKMRGYRPIQQDFEYWDGIGFPDPANPSGYLVTFISIESIKHVR